MRKKIADINSKKTFLLFVLTILLQLFVFVYLGFNRQDFFIDEIYSYILSNSYDADRITNDSQMWDRWIHGNDLYELLTVQDGEQFSYDKVYYNNSLDAHPPLYYYLLHTICSFFPNVFSEWFGLVLNYVLFVLTQLSLWILAKKVIGNDMWANLVVLLYGATHAGLGTVLSIRMYMLMTLFTVLIAIVHYELQKKQEITIKDCFLCFLVTFLGTYTQYFFAVTAFSMAIACCLYYIIQKRWKNLIKYACSMMLAIVCVFITYPAGITQITGSSTNNVGNEVARNFFNFSGWIKATLSLTCQIVDNIILGPQLFKRGIVVILLVSFVITVFWKNKTKGKKIFSEIQIFNISLPLYLTAISVFSCSFILTSHLCGEYLYTRYVFNLVPIIILIAIIALKYICINVSPKFICVVLTFLMLSAGISMAILTRKELSNEVDSNKQKVMCYCESIPLIVISDDVGALTGDFLVMAESKSVLLFTLQPKRQDRILY